jgi:hydrophobe/amphiphile efflux-1 (HAE1) family protein
MQWLAQVCVKRPIFATVLSLVIVVTGYAFYKQLGVDQFPKIDLPIVNIVTRLPGASPEDVETELTDKIEGAVNTISGIDELRSISSEGVSQVLVTFLLEKNADVAAQEVREKVAAVLGELPNGVEQPIVSKVDPDAQPVLYLALQAKGKDRRTITDYADRVVRRRLESVSGVGEVRILGGQKRQVNVSVDPVKMKALGVTAAEVARALGAQNLTLPGGRVDESRDLLTVRVHGRVNNVDELKRIIVRYTGGRTIRVDDVATVEDGAEEQETAAIWNGEPTVVLAVRKQSGTNTVEVVDDILRRVKELKGELPADYSLETQRDASGTIRTSTEAVAEHLIVGAILAALVVLLFLGNVRSTIIAALAIPTSIIGTFLLMYLKGYTLNTITLLALALAVGIVIDDAIVVLENIFKHVDEKGMPPKQAAIEGTKEIGLAVLATTLSLIAVFVPIAFIAGIPGRFLASFGITMAFSIAVSLFVSFTLTPMLASVWLKRKRPGAEHKKTFLERVVDVVYRPIERAYMRLLGFCMRRRWVVVVASFATLGSCFPLAKIARKGFLPIDDKAQFEVTVRLPEGRSLASAEMIGERVARQIRELPEVTATLVTVGDDVQRTPNLARIYVKLVDPAARVRTQDQMKDVIRHEILAKLPKDLRTLVADVNEFGGGQSTARIQYILSGPDLKTLETSATRIIEKMRKVPGAVDLDTTMIVGKPELGVYIDRDRAADLGVQVADVAQAMQMLVGGQKVSTYAEQGEQYDIRLRAAKEFRDRESALALLTVPSTKLGQVSLADVVRFHHGTGPSVINRFNRERQVTLLANGAPGSDESKIGQAMVDAFKAEGLPTAYQLRGSGQTKFMAQTMISFAIGLLMSIIFMYLILAAQFESWLHPITILLSLPLTLPFAVLSVVLFGLALDIYSMLGIFVLFGVVKKNAILQIDHTNQLREQGLPRNEAILRANKDRLRPILMTTLAFVAGMLPLVMSKGIGAGFNRATAGVVVGGQTFSLLLTLVAVPVAYSFFDDLSQAVVRLRQRIWPSDDDDDESATGADEGGARASG